MADEHYTLLGVRPDGVVPVVDLMVETSAAAAIDRARSFLNEHLSCSRVEIWAGGRLLEEIARGAEAAE